MDLLYLFWSISAGIIVGVGLYMLAVVLSVVMTVLLFAMGLIPNTKAPELLVLRGVFEESSYTVLYDAVRKHCKYYKEKARTTRNKETEIVIEIRTKEKDALLQDLGKMDFFAQINCICHDGECRV